jgi:hypothetical protein
MEEGERDKISLEELGFFLSWNETGFSHAEGGRASCGRFEDILAGKSFE